MDETSAYFALVQAANGGFEVAKVHFLDHRFEGSVREEVENCFALVDAGTDRSTKLGVVGDQLVGRGSYFGCAESDQHYSAPWFDCHSRVGGSCCTFCPHRVMAIILKTIVA